MAMRRNRSRRPSTPVEAAKLCPGLPLAPDEPYSAKVSSRLIAVLGDLYDPDLNLDELQGVANLGLKTWNRAVWRAKDQSPPSFGLLDKQSRRLVERLISTAPYTPSSNEGGLQRGPLRCSGQGYAASDWRRTLARSRFVAYGFWVANTRANSNSIPPYRIA